MNKFLKGCLITVLVLVVLGTILGGIGWVLGGNHQVNAMIRNGDLNYNLPWKIEKKIEDKVARYEATFENEFEEEWGHSDILTGEIKKRDIVAQSSVRELSVEIGYGMLYIVETEEEKFSIKSNTSNRYQYYMDESTLKIQAFQEAVIRDEINVITLYVPRGFRFDEVDISLGGAYVEIDSLKAQDIDIEAGAGELSIESLEADEINLEVDAGEVIIENANVKNAELKLGVGNLSYEGSISGNVDAKCAIGNMELLLDGKEKDYNYRIEGALGNITIGDSDYTGMSMTKNINNNAASTFYLECGVGNLEINFK